MFSVNPVVSTLSDSDLTKIHNKLIQLQRDIDQAELDVIQAKENLRLVDSKKQRELGAKLEDAKFELRYAQNQLTFAQELLQKTGRSELIMA